MTQPYTPSADSHPDHRPSRRHALLAAIVIVALAAAAIATGMLLTRGGDDSNGAATTTSVSAPTTKMVTTTALPTTVAPPPPTVAGARYRDEVFVDVTVQRDVQYGSAPGADGVPTALLLDLYLPEGDVTHVRPALVWVHGGGFKGGDKAEGLAALMAPRFARLGYVVVSIGYRLLAPVSCTGVDGISPVCYVAAVAAVHDGQAAVRWLRANADQYGIDPERIAIAGESAGGIVATGVGLYAEEPGDSGNPGLRSDVRAWVSISGGVPGGLFVDAGDAPGLLIAGTADGVVPYSWSVETADALRAVGVEALLVTLEGAGHVPFAEHGEQITRETITFLFDQLELAVAA